MKISLSCLLLLLVSIVGNMQDTMARDEIELPPIKRVFTSVSGDFELTIKRPQHLTPNAFPQADLYRIAADGKRTKIWDKTLSIYIGPRFVLVSDTGYVIFFDEWLRKVATDYAIQIFLPDGSISYNSTLKNIITITALKWSEITKIAKYGAWLSTVPMLLHSEYINFEVGGVPLILKISEGKLEVQDD